ncbi:MAG TPA: FHA domain-containing protein [Fimbriiglobus sp.]|jgi:pSer/pThr/pTyr-binding forkhead associated (FHA) protein
MQTVTFLVLEGVDKGRVFRDMAVPISIGREEGNTLRLNDERVSRWHAKIQTEDGDVILTDLDSTNGTRVNGSTIQIRRLRAGDQVSIGRTMLLFGTMDEIAARRNTVAPAVATTGAVQTLRLDELKASKPAPSATLAAPVGEWSPREEDVPPLPQKLTGSQAARLAEIFDHLHRGLTLAVETMEEAKEDGTEIKLGFAEWQLIQAVHALLARYGRQIAEPDGGD